MSEESHKLAAIVFTDIVGYTRRMEESEQRTMQLLQKQREIVFPIVKSYGGEVVKELGDGLLLMFGSAVEAVRCAISIQTRLKDEELTIRAGIHIGDVIFKDGDVFGSAVNASARIQPLASQNGVCISEDVKNQIQNKGFNLSSIGKKELKGFKEPVEIYELFIEGVSQPKKITLRSFFIDLWKRHVFLTIGIYLVAAWIIKLAVSSFVSRNLYSPYLVDLTWIILLSLIPTVFLLSYYHGRRSSGKWTKAEIIGLPANVVLSIVLAVMLFKGKDLGAATTSVSTLDEKGEIIERTFLKGEFRKKAVIFFFENKSSDTSLNWIQYAMPNLIEYDLSQDLFLEAQNALSYLGKFREAGYDNGLGAPLTLMKKIAAGVYQNTFMTGTYNFIQGKYNISIQLFDTQTGKTLTEHQYTGDNLFKITDEITLSLKDDLGIPKQHIEETTDLPVSEIYTPSFKALEYFTKGYLEIALNNDWEKGVKLTEKATAEDPGFMAAHLTIAQFYFNNNQTEEALSSLELTMNNLYKLPERQQFFTKYFYYLIKKEADKAHAVCKMWTDLYPDDIKAHTMLAESFRKRNEMGKTIQEYKTILSLDPGQFNILRVVGDLYEQTAKYDSAAFYYSSYAKEFPGDYRSYRDLGELYVMMAEFGKAKENFDKALLLEAENISVMLAIGDLNIRDGNFDKTFEIYQGALTSSKSARDSAAVYFEMEKYSTLKGQIVKSFDFYNLGMEKFSRYNPPKNIMVQSTFNVDKYVLAGKGEEAFKLLKKIELESQPPLDKVASFGFLFYYVELGDANEAEKYIPNAMEVISGFGEEVLMANIYYAKARIAEIRQNFKQGLENYTQYAKMQPNAYPAYQWMARCHRELGDFNKAKENILLALKYHPTDPENNYEAAMIYMKLKDKLKAKDHIDKALKIWANADANYKPFQNALLAKNQIELI